MCQPGPVTFRRRSVHEPHEIGSIPTPAPEAGESRKGRLDVPYSFGGPQPERGPRRARRPSGRYGGRDEPAGPDGGQIESDVLDAHLFRPGV